MARGDRNAKVKQSNVTCTLDSCPVPSDSVKFVKFVPGGKVEGKEEKEERDLEPDAEVEDE